jgi:hypothetical protein
MRYFARICSTSCPDRWDRDIRETVNLWCSDPAVVEEQYGHISKWDVSHVTNMDRLFYDKRAFNEDIRAWRVSSVTTVQCMFSGAGAFNEPLLALCCLGCIKCDGHETMRGVFNYYVAFEQPLLLAGIRQRRR